MSIDEIVNRVLFLTRHALISKNPKSQQSSRRMLVDNRSSKNVTAYYIYHYDTNINPES